ncbi:MAG: DUF4190 domain-containing protein [Planctomycetaceae bacterium]|nr:DUF4190 domain-containing protein [Planctomycetaceae bacterium]
MSQNCPKCQTPNPPHAQFCHNCGTRFGGATVFAGPVPHHPQVAAVGVGPVGAPPTNGPFIGQPQNVPTVGMTTAQPGASKLAVASLILAILALFCFGPLTGIPAAILGWMELTAIKQGRSDQSNAWMAHVGLWGGIVLSILTSGFFFLMLILSAASAGMNDPYMSPYGGY